MRIRTWVGIAIGVGTSFACGGANDERLVFRHLTYDAWFGAGDCRCASPVASSSTLYLCGGHSGARQERFVAVDLATRRVKWEREVPGGCGALTVAGDAIFAWDGRTLTAFDTTGATTWSRNDVWRLPFLVDGRVYLSRKATPAFVVVDPRTWRQVAALALPEVPDREPLVEADAIRYGTRTGRLVMLDRRDDTATSIQVASRILSPLVRHGATLVFSAEVPGGSALMGFDLERNAVRWTVDTQVLGQATPLIVGDRVVFGSDRLYDVDIATGASRSVDLSGGPAGNPVLDAGTLYVAGGRIMHALDPATLAVRWTFAARKWIDAPPTGGVPLIQDGVLYFGSLDCAVYGIRAGA
jgi:outer membrane protein assembly factor BamB